MASERAKADEENLRQTAFEKGEWANQPPTDLDVDYDLLSGSLEFISRRSRHSYQKVAEMISSIFKLSPESMT